MQRVPALVAGVTMAMMTACTGPHPVEPAPAAPVAAPATTTTILPRVVVDQPWLPFATVAGLTLRSPSNRVERDAFHQSNNDGAQPMQFLPTAVAPVVLASRERDTPGNTAVDVVVDPEVQIRAPVSGTVKRSGSYVLYCNHRDHYVVISPDGRPALEVKVLHIADALVGRGQRLEAGATVIASRATRLPFASQVEEVSARPPWPHVHIEVVDPTVPDRPSPSNCD